MVLVATEVESNYKISKIIDIFPAILNTVPEWSNTDFCVV